MIILQLLWFHCDPFQYALQSRHVKIGVIPSSAARSCFNTYVTFELLHFLH